MRRKTRRQRPADLISAQEVASFAYCPESWRLQYGLGLEPVSMDPNPYAVSEPELLRSLGLS
jgi:hypothetical protein